MRVKAAAGRRGVKGLREEGVKLPRLRDALTRGFLIWNFGLAEEIGSRKGRKGRKGRLVIGDWGTDCSRPAVPAPTPVGVETQTRPEMGVLSDTGYQ